MRDQKNPYELMLCGAKFFVGKNPAECQSRHFTWTSKIVVKLL
jgi:hypothetical protein